MSSINTISIEKLAKLVGTPRCPTLLDIRSDQEFAADPRLIPSSRLAGPQTLGDRLQDSAARIVVSQRGGADAHGHAAWLRPLGCKADVLEGGYEAWAAGGLPLVQTRHLPDRDELGRTVWVTRERPKVDRIACPWLIRRFVDPLAVFLFVPSAEALEVSERFGGAPFDIEGVFWSHRGDRCTFDTMIEEFGLSTDPLSRLSTMVRGADTARPDLSPQAAGLLAASLGLSRMYSDDLEQLDAGMLLYDALYRWCRDATGEVHDWVPGGSHPGKGR
jgi:rhodanese-related sulfurtransferase